MRNLTTKEHNMLNSINFVRKHENIALILIIIILPFTHPIYFLLSLIDGGIIRYLEDIRRYNIFRDNYSSIKRMIKLKLSKGE